MKYCTKNNIFLKYMWNYGYFIKYMYIDILCIPYLKYIEDILCIIHWNALNANKYMYTYVNTIYILI